MNELQVFNFRKNEVRTLTKDNEIYFVGKDVSKILGYRDTADALKRHVDEEDKGVGEIPTPGGEQKMIILNESGMYSLVLSSKLPQAKEFKKWVTSEVLPSIRKTGSYQRVPTTTRELIQLSLKANEETAERVDVIEKDVRNIKENAKLEPSEYNLVGKLVSRRVWGFIEDYRLSKAKEQKSLLYRDINSGINQLCGIRTRGQIRQRDFDRVINFIDDWSPSTITKHKIKELENKKESVTK